MVKVINMWFNVVMRWFIIIKLFNLNGVGIELLLLFVIWCGVVVKIF